MPEPSAVDTQRVHRGQLVNEAGTELGSLGEVLQPLLAGSGGAGFVLGDEVLRTSDPDLAAGNEITPLDPTKAVLVNIKVTGGTDGSSVSINSWNGQSSVAGYAPQGFQISLALLLAPGETYYFNAGGAALERAIERTIG